MQLLYYIGFVLINLKLFLAHLNGKFVIIHNLGQEMLTGYIFEENHNLKLKRIVAIRSNVLSAMMIALGRNDKQFYIN